MRLRVLSLNVWGLPPPVGSYVRERLELVLRDLPRHECDLALFQEVWTEPAREQLIAGGRALGFEHSWTQGPARGGGGLLALSKRPIEATGFRRYTLCGLPQRLTQMDFYSGKGVARLEIEIGGVALTVFNTHMHARYAPAEVQDDYVGHRTAEVIELAEEVRAVSGPLIAVGDFNMQDSAPEYAVMIGLTGLADAAAELDVREPTVLLRNAYRRRREAPSEYRIDYVFGRSGTQVGVRPVSFDRIYDEDVQVADEVGAYSDHAGLLAEIEIGGPGEPNPPIAPDTIARSRTLLAEGRQQALVRRDHQRLGAVASALVGAGAFRAARRRLTRRRFLHASTWGFAGLAALSGTSLVTLAERFVPDELAGYASVEATLARLADSQRLARGEPAAAASSLR